MHTCNVPANSGKEHTHYVNLQTKNMLSVHLSLHGEMNNATTRVVTQPPTTLTEQLPYKVQRLMHKKPRMT